VLIKFNDVSYSKEVFANDITMRTTTRHYVSLCAANNMDTLRRLCLMKNQNFNIPTLKVYF